MVQCHLTHNPVLSSFMSVMFIIVSVNKFQHLASSTTSQLGVSSVLFMGDVASSNSLNFSTFGVAFGTTVFRPNVIFSSFLSFVFAKD